MNSTGWRERSSISRAIALFILSLCLGSAVAMGQSSAGMNGQVLDSSGAAVQGAFVVVVNDDTNARYTTKTNGDGIYVFTGLPPGKYHLEISQRGFKAIVEPGIVLHLQETRSANFALQVGEVSETVTVKAGDITMNTTDATVSTLVDHTYVENMPLNGRSFQDLILLTPGVVTNSPQQTVGGLNTLGRTGEFSVNGQRTESNYYSVDGVSANVGVANDTQGGMLVGPGSSGSLAASTALGTTQALVSVDDLQEFRVQSSTYSAQYGRNPGGQFAFDTKSGTNQWHGTAFDYLRNNALDSNDWFNNFFGIRQPALRQNDFGGSLGGPVRLPRVYNGKDKTFFFVSYEGLRLTQPQEATPQFVPDNCMRGVAGACAGLTGPDGMTQRTPAYGTLLPLVNAFPVQSPSLPNGGEFDSVNGVGEFLGSWSNPGTLNTTSIRLDQVVNGKMTLFFRFSDSNSSTESFSPPSVTETPFLLRTYTAGANNILSNRLSNEFRLNYTSNEVTPKVSIKAFGGSTPVDMAAYLGLASTSFPQIILLLGNQQIFLDQGLGKNQQRQWNLVDTVSYSAGAHQFKFGADYRRLTPLVVPTSALQYLFFSEPSVESGAYDFGNALNAATAYPLYTNFSAFAQDDWKVSNRLTLSFGLRWDVNPAPSVTQGALPYTITGTNPNNYALAPYDTPLWQTTWFNFAPRLGVAYVLRDTPGWETVVRGGGGVFFDTGQQDGGISFTGPGYAAQNILATGGPNDIFQSAATCAPSGPNANCPATLIPPITHPPTGPAQLAYLSGFYPHLQLPYTLQWNASIQQALGKSQAFTVSYVGSHGSRLLQEIQYTPLSNPNPDIVQIFHVQNGLTSDYNALQAQFQRRLTQGLTALGSYTWSHCIDYGSVNFGLPYQRGNCDFDVRQNLSAAFSYSLPNVGRDRFQKAVLNHWGVDDRFTARTAFPVFMIGRESFDPTTGTELAASYLTVPGQPLYLNGQACNEFFAPVFQQFGSSDRCPGGRAINPCAFYPTAAAASSVQGYYPLCPNQNPTVGGIVPRNAARGFGAVQMDVAIRRDFPIYEKLKLQFRAEAFNLFNHPNFGSVDAYGPTMGLATHTLATSLGVLSQQYQMGGPRSMQFALKLIF
jgi:Carboxypeptidase regulatory-like domain/TonB dependent receptor